MKPRGRVFICYRREGGAEMARLVHDNLRDRGFEVFMDVEDLKSGPFDESLLREIESSTDVVVILSGKCLERCVEEGDWLRWEIRHAIACQKNIVPVRTRDFVWPDSLPEDLKPLPYYHAVEPSPSLFKASIDKLITLLKANPRLASSHRTRQLLTVSGVLLLVILAALYWRQPHGNATSFADENVHERPDGNGWIPLFDGKTLSGWTAPDEGDWTVSDGILTGRGKVSHLFSPFIYTNLEFRTEVKLNHAGNSGMFFRATLSKGPPVGYEAQMENTGNDFRHTGSLLDVGGVPKQQALHLVSEQLVPDDTWWTQHVIAIGNRIIIKVNDRIVTDFVDPENRHKSGYLALQQWAAPKIGFFGSVVKFRNVMAKRLPNDEQEAWANARKDMPDIKIPSGGAAR